MGLRGDSIRKPEWAGKAHTATCDSSQTKPLVGDRIQVEFRGISVTGYIFGTLPLWKGLHVSSSGFAWSAHSHPVQ
jgi:hypothetical protein